VILIPALLAVFAVAMAFGRTTSAGGDVSHAARVAARAAAQAQTVGGATERATAVAGESLADAGLSCTTQQTSVTADMRPGGRVGVTVTCVVDLSDVAGLAIIPGARTLSATAWEIIDAARGGAP
jgi:Flp pilus assembly protein TadG